MNEKVCRAGTVNFDGLVKAGGSFTVNANVVLSFPSTLETVTFTWCTPPEPTAGTPERVAFPPLNENRRPGGSPDAVITGTGKPNVGALKT